MFIPPEMAAYRPRVPGQLSPRTPGAQPGMLGMQPGPMRMPGGPMQQPPKPPTPGIRDTNSIQGGMDTLSEETTLLCFYPFGMH